MDRRQFCRATLGTTLFSSYAWLTGCERSPDTAAVPPRRADTGIPAVALDGSAIELEKAAVNELADALSGEVLLSGHPAYDSARKIWNGMHDKHPALIAQCRNAQDIGHAVTFARERNLLVSVRGGGHSWPGKSVCDGGLMVDLSPMNTVDVDPAKRRAYAQGGALLNALDTASRRHGLITTAGVVSHTGVGGFTLGGGFGRLNRKFGLAVDNLRGAEIVTADGKVRRISAEQEPDLFWAIRGGGGNFGVVSQFEYELHPFPLEVYSGNIVWPIDDARAVLDFYGEWYSGLSDDLYAGPAMLTMPDGTSVLVMEVVYAGDPAQGEKEIAPLLAVAKPLENGLKVQDYMVMQTQEDATFSHGIRSYAKNGMVKEITPELVDAMIESFVPDPRLALFTHTAGGAVKRVDELETSFPHRNAETMIIVAGGWTSPEHDREAIDTARAWFAALEPFTGGYYDNIEFEGEHADENYGPAYPRLAKIKAQYDPGNLFRLNANIAPAAA
ncbi:MAG TPA: FAD-binding oxidoreductase [Woeseiaceae bacterium]|nr:FAD-binding oxidoreductase [Woeseiaceae bacterium]